MTRLEACFAIQFTIPWLKGFVPFKITSDFEHFSSDLLFEGALMETSPTHHSNAQQKFNLTHHWSGEGKAEGFPRERLSMNVEFAKKAENLSKPHRMVSRDLERKTMAHEIQWRLVRHHVRSVQTNICNCSPLSSAENGSSKTSVTLQAALDAPKWSVIRKTMSTTCVSSTRWLPDDVIPSPKGLIDKQSLVSATDVLCFTYIWWCWLSDAFLQFSRLLNVKPNTWYFFLQKIDTLSKILAATTL